MTFTVVHTFGQVPKKYESLERIFNKNNKLVLEDVPQHYLDTINLTLKNTNLIYRRYFYPDNHESYDTMKYQFEIDDNSLYIVKEHDTLFYQIDSYFRDQKDLFTGDFFLFVKDNHSIQNVGYLSIYYIDDKCVVLKEIIYINKRFLFFNWKSSKVKSVLLLEF